MFKVAVFSDIHGNLEALQAILANIEKNEFDEIVCLGDVIGIGPNSKECLDLIISNHIKLVLGNHERYYLNGTHNETKMSTEEKRHHAWIHDELNGEYKDILSKLDIEFSIAVNGEKIGFMHYPFDKIGNDFYTPKELTEENVKHLFRNYNYRFIFFGHSHTEQFYKDNGHCVYFNLGSAGCTKENITHYTILEYDGKDYNIYKQKCIYDRKKFDEKMDRINYPEKEILRKIYF